MKEEGSWIVVGAARELAADDFQIAVLSSSGKGEALAKELGGIGVTGPNPSKNDLQILVDQIMVQWGRIDMLVNSAGHGPRGARARDHGRRLVSWPGNLISKRGTVHAPSPPPSCENKNQD